MNTKDIVKKYGQPTQTGSRYLTTIDLPYPMRIAWDKKTIVKKMRCHKLIAQNFINVFNELLNHYGLQKIQELEIDLFGGCFNFRQMRQGNGWSRHSWGIAIDLSPEKNSMNTNVKNAQFGKPEYKPMIEIFKKNGFSWGGDLWGKDCMHFEINN